MEGVDAHGRGLDLDDVWGPSNPKHSMSLQNFLEIIKGHGYLNNVCDIMLW